MNITDIFIRRPVLACVVSLLILMFGFRAVTELPVREYPETLSTVITVRTMYPGANAELMEGFITRPIQKAMASADGIDFIFSESAEGVSQIKAQIELDYDPQAAFTDIMSKVASVRNELPRESEDPVILSETDADSPVMYIGFNSNELTVEQITDYVARVAQPKIESVSGVAQAQIIGGSVFAMRIWLDPNKMAAYGISPTDVSDALVANNYQSAAGGIKGEYVAIGVIAETDLHDVKEFEDIVIRTEGGSPVRIKDVGITELGGENYDSAVSFNGQSGVFVGVTTTPRANPLPVITEVRDIFPSIINDLPPSINAEIQYDATDYIRASIKEVFKTIIEATFIVIIVIFLFLGSVRAVVIPMITIPLSLIGVCSLMLFLGYSINLLTLLAMVLAIGLVVDDAIVVLENIHRHIENGEPPFTAAINGAREITVPIIAMTITLAAVYAPIGFLGGLTGALFKEFAFTLAAAVLISGVIALTLTPMMCSKMLGENVGQSRFAQLVDRIFHHLQALYQKILQDLLKHRPIVVVFALTVLASLYFLYGNTKKETAPEEDSGLFLLHANAPEYASLDYVQAYSQQFNKIFNNLPEMRYNFIIDSAGLGMGNSAGGNRSIGGVILKPWDQRERSLDELRLSLQQQVDEISGLQTNAVIPNRLPAAAGGGAPVQFVITSTSDYEAIYTVAEEFLKVARESGLFAFVKNSLRFDRPQIAMSVDRDKAAYMGITMERVGAALARGLSEGYINRFSVEGYSYKVIPQLERRFRLHQQDLEDIYVSTKNGEIISLSTIVKLEEKSQPNLRSQFQQLNSARIYGTVMPGYTLGDAVEFFEAQAVELLPQGMSYDYSGRTRQFVQEGKALIIAFFFSLIIIFLVLAAQYESFRDPLIILISVPMSICGALIPLNLGLATINIYTQIGLITLIGLISKHGILMVDFANHLQVEKGLSIREAIIESASIRLRPILMTTGAMVFGVVPLLLAQGAGANSRFGIGLVISTGLAIGTLFTLFVVPTMYTFLAKQREPKEIEAGAIEEVPSG